MQTLKQIDVKNKVILLRVDYNVPVDELGRVIDTARIVATKPTIDYLREQGAKIVLLAHFGRPKGKVVEQMRFRPIVTTISTVLGIAVHYVDEAIGTKAKEAVRSLKPGEVILLENIRFYPGEEKNDTAFAQQLAELGDVYVNDAFGTAHRAHASTAGVAAFLPHAAGLLLEREVEALQRILEKPEHPLVAIIGGAKISTKIDLIRNLLPKIDILLLGGALANTLLFAQGKNVGKSLVEAELATTVRDLFSEKLITPVDVVVAKDVNADAPPHVMEVHDVADDEHILDIGPKTVQLYSSQIANAKTILWNGPMGMFELKPFARGTFAIAKAVAASKAYSVLGGGETVSAVHQLGLAEKVSFISTGGGAMLEFMEGKPLSGIVALA